VIRRRKASAISLRVASPVEKKRMLALFRITHVYNPTLQGGKTGNPVDPLPDMPETAVYDESVLGTLVRRCIAATARPIGQVQSSESLIYARTGFAALCATIALRKVSNE